MYCLIVPEVSAEKGTYQPAVYGGVIAWEMYVFKVAEEAFQICSEFLYLGGLSCPVLSHKAYLVIIADMEIYVIQQS